MANAIATLRIFYLFFVTTIAFSAAAENPLQVSVSRSTERNDELRVSVMNNSEKSVEILSYPLSFYSIKTTILSTENVPISLEPRSRYRIQHYPSTTIIAPGEVMGGKIRLADRYEEFEKFLTKTELIVFWYWRPEKINGSRTEGQAGWVIIPKSVGPP